MAKVTLQGVINYHPSAFNTRQMSVTTRILTEWSIHSKIVLQIAFTNQYQEPKELNSKHLYGFGVSHMTSI